MASAKSARTETAAFLAEWITNRAVALAPRTIAGYRQLIAHYVNPAIGSIPLGKLDAGAVTAILANIAQTGHSRTAEAVFVLLRCALRNTCAARIMAQVPRPRHVPASPSWWTGEEVQGLLSASPVPAMRLAWLLALCCGLRRGEICGLRWCDVDLPAKVIRVANARSVISGHGTVDGPPKSKSGQRVIPLPEVLVEALSSARLMAEADKLLGRPASPYVLRGNSRGGLSPHTLDSWLAQCIQAAGLRPIRLHDLRHTMAAIAITQGVDVRVLQSLLGHASVTTTAHIYAHVTTRAQRSAVDRIAGVLTLNQGVQGSSP